MFLCIGFTVHDSAYHLYHQHKYKEIKRPNKYVFLETGTIDAFYEKKFLILNANSYNSSCLLSKKKNKTTTHK